MFEHSVKVPKQYKVAANIIKKVSTEGGSVKTLLYDTKLRHFRTNVLFALLNKAIKHGAEIDKIFEDTEILSKESRLDPWLAKVLTTELLYGKQSLPGRSKPELTILNYKEQFEKCKTAHQDVTKTEAAPKPRYVRINTSLLTTSDAIRAFQEEGYRFIRCTSGGYDEYLKQIQGLNEDEFTQDYHVKTVFVFPAGTRLHDHELYLENKIILQDKATTMAVNLLAPPPGSIVLDMCAAPGMKTTQMAAYMRNEGTIYAVERDEKRYATLCDFVEKTGSKCVKTLHKDAFEVKGGEFDEVEYVLLDPSCSGSGMELSVHNYVDATRLAKLTSVQEKFLKHAMNAFPKAKKIVYSTCSLHPEENERVVTNVVKMSRAKWWVKDVKELLKGQWNNFGSHVYGTLGAKCMYAKPDSDLTRGFFLAVLERDLDEVKKRKEDGVERNKNGSDKNEIREKVEKKKNNKHRNNEIEIANNTEDSALGEEQLPKKKMKKKIKDVDEGESNINETESLYNTESNGLEEGQVPKKKKKNKKKNKDIEKVVEEEQININQEEIPEICESKTRKKKKNKNKEREDSEVNFEIREDSAEVNGADLEVSNNKKKRKKDVSVEVNEDHLDVSGNVDEVPKKKKNRNKSEEYVKFD